MIDGDLDVFGGDEMDEVLPAGDRRAKATRWSSTARWR